MEFTGPEPRDARVGVPWNDLLGIAQLLELIDQGVMQLLGTRDFVAVALVLDFVVCQLSCLLSSDGPVNVVEAALWIAKEEYPDLDVNRESRQLDAISATRSSLVR